MTPAANKFLKHAVSAFLAVVAWPSLAFISAYPPARHAAAIRPSGAADAFAYDGRGNQTAYTNAEGHVYTMAYDAMGRMTAATNAAGIQVLNASYDSVGNLTNRVDGNDNAISYAYDALNRIVTSVATGRGGPPLRSAFAYDAAGNMLTASNGTAVLTFGYDAMDRLTSASTEIGASAFDSQWTRDNGGLVTNLTYAAGKSVSQAYDANGRLVSVKDWLGHEWTFTYDALGRVTATTSPNGLSDTFTYDDAGRLTGRACLSETAAELWGRTTTYDGANRRVRDDITAGPMPTPTSPRQAANTFDAADRLVSASVRYGTDAPVAETFSYDPNGAMTNWTGGAGGNASLSLTYNALGQLGRARLSETAAEIDFYYDALGNRLKSDDTLFIPNHADPLKRPLIECAASGVPLRHYIWGDGVLLGIIDSNGTLSVAHSDEQGSVIALTDSAGNVTHTALYGPHGEDWGATGTNPTPFAWLGGYGVHSLCPLTTDHCPLKLYLTRHRVYSATLNRFLSPDPLGLAGGLNLYAYGEGNPLAYIDPLGLSAENWSGALTRAGGGLQMIGGTIEGVIGLAATYFSGGIAGAFGGIGMYMHGADVMNAGFNTMWNGTPTDTYTSQAMQTLGIPQNVANGIDAGLSMGATTAVGATVNAARTASAVPSMTAPAFPSNRGFMPGEGTPSSLLPGTVVDRYGGTGGQFLSPQGTPASARSLPSGINMQPLNTYEVVKPFEVNTGRIAPWNGQPGLGIQYDLQPRSVQYYLDKGYLRPRQ